jgi:hypothetical protein
MVREGRVLVALDDDGLVIDIVHASFQRPPIFGEHPTGSVSGVSRVPVPRSVP